jgi:NAD dependent epimerase/dehydratase family enzyme
LPEILIQAKFDFKFGKIRQAIADLLR